MNCVRILGLLGIFLALGCSHSGREESSKPKQLIIGRWESKDVGIEFTSAGSILQSGQKVVGQYQFLDDRTIETKSGEKQMKLTDVFVSGDELSFTVNGKSEKFKRVKDFSARVLGRLPNADTPAPPRPTGPLTAEGPIINQKADGNIDREVKPQEPKNEPRPDPAPKEPEKVQPPKDPLPAPKKVQPLKKPDGG